MRQRALRGRALAVAALVIACASPAKAQGIGLEEVLEVVKGDPELVRQIDVELRRRDLKARTIVCASAHHGSEWRLLGGGRAAPYACRIGEVLLRIDAQRTYFDASGRKLGQIGQAPGELLLSRARYFREGKFQWSWNP
jgi:hypothetical protein